MLHMRVHDSSWSNTANFAKPDVVMPSSSDGDGARVRPAHGNTSTPEPVTGKPAAGKPAAGKPAVSKSAVSKSAISASSPAALGSAGYDSAQIGRDILIPLPAGWTTANGDVLVERHVRARLIGPKDAPVIGVFGGISATRFVAREAGVKGWWHKIAGPGQALDTRAFCLLGLDYAPVEGDSPITITPADHARLLALVLEHLQIDRLHAVVGASYGGMVALAFARQFPHRVARLVVLAAAHRPSAMGTAWRGVQRRIITFAQAAGNEAEGVALARQLAMTTYRCADEFGDRFGSGVTDIEAEIAGEGGSQVCQYLCARGESYAQTTPAWRYLSLSRAIDLHHEDPSQISTPTALIAFEPDQIAPVDDMKHLQSLLAGPATLTSVDAPTGHDAFLTETGSVSRALIDALAGVDAPSSTSVVQPDARSTPPHTIDLPTSQPGTT